MMRRWHTLFLALFFCLWVLPLQAAEPVAVRGGLHPDYGRLVFDWPREVGYDARVEGGSLVIQFAEAADFSGKVLRDGLRGYAAAPERSADGRRLSFALNGDLNLKHFRIGAKVVLDLRTRPDGSTPSGPGSEKAAAAPQNLPSVKVRGGRHADYSRLVFDWPQEVGSRIEESPGSARIVFDRKARFDISAVRPGRLPQIDAVTAEPDGLSVAMEAGAKPRISRSGTKVILDVIAAKAAPPATDSGTDDPLRQSPAAPTPKTQPPTVTTPANKDAAPGVVDLSPRADAEGPDENAPPLQSQGAPSDETSKSARDAVPEGSGAKDAGLKTASPEDAGGDDPAAPGVAPTPLVPESMGGKAESPAPKAEAGQSADLPAEGQEDATKDDGDTTFYGESAGGGEGYADALRGRMEVALEPVITFESSSAQGPTADRFVPVVLTLDWGRPAAAAAFRRGENVWLVFDRPPPPDLVKRLAATAPHLGSVRLIEAGEATVMVIATLPTVAPRLSRDGNRWMVDLRPRSPLPQKALATPVVEDKGYKRVRFPMSGADRLFWVTDPNAGDRLIVVPTRGAGMGLTLPHGYPQFRSLPSQQGVILQPLTSTLQVAVTRSGVLVRDADGLLVSSAEERRGARRAGETDPDEPRLFDLVAWRRGGQEDYQMNRRALMDAMIGLNGESLGVQRTELARLFFAHGLDSEALGSLRVIEEEHPRLALSPEHRLMQAASQWLIQDYRAAAAGLADPALAGEREALLWHAALAAQAEDWQAAANGFDATDDLIATYPRRVRLRLRLAAAEAFLGAGDAVASTLQLGALRREDLNSRELAPLAVIQGAVQLQQGNAEEARALWESARDSRHRPSQARARLALIDLGLEEGSLSTDEAIAELERLRFAWRGDQFEFKLLRRLAQLYVDQNRHREALYALRQAVTAFPDSPGARDSAQKMREIFAEIYRGVGDPGVPPLRALALYQEFKELTPTGAEGDRMITSLADRLVEVDLLDRAAELLEGQVRYRLEGEEKARIGARLALVHLLDRNPESSLDALDVSKADEIDEALKLQRQQLRARAFSDLNRPQDALEMLKGDESLNAETLRADIHWRLRRWPAAVESLTKLIPLLPPRRAMTLEESQRVVNLAVALMLSNQTVELEDLDRRYGAAMAQGPHSDTFNLLVGDGEKTAVSSIAEELSKVAEAQDFMANYRERLRDGELSQVN